VKNLAFNARHFDRYFLHELEWSDWESIIKKMQASLTDEAIDEAISLFPKEILKLNDDEELAHLLKARRTNLMKIGKRHYDFLSREVEITGTDNKDHFELTRNADGSLHVLVTLKSKEHGTLTKYDRTFYPSETKEVRLYGLRGDDSFELRGDNNLSIRIKIIGGEGEDEVDNFSTDRKLAVYDEIGGVEITGPARNKTSKDLSVNEYDRNGFQYNSSLPLLIFGNTVDDGWWFWGSISWTKRAWRKAPYKSKQGFSFSVAPGSRDPYQIGYNGHFPAAIGKLDFAPKADLSFPHYENYFGLGNSSFNDLNNPIEFNWVRMQGIDINPRLRANLGSNAQLDFGPVFQYRNISTTEGSVSTEGTLAFSDDELESRKYYGADFLYSLGITDSNSFPSNGFRFNASSSYLVELTLDETVAEIAVDAQFYLTLISKPRLVFATQLGYGKSFGDLQFYQHQDLGNNTGLRGFRNERFRGESVFFHNMDLRMKLIKWDNTFIPMDIGILGGYDYGRVNLKGETIDDWHTSQTIGVWFQLLGAMVVQPYYSFNKEQNTFSLRVGFNF